MKKLSDYRVLLVDDAEVRSKLRKNHVSKIDVDVV